MPPQKAIQVSCDDEVHQGEKLKDGCNNKYATTGRTKYNHFFLNA